MVDILNVWVDSKCFVEGALLICQALSLNAIASHVERDSVTF